MEYTITAKVKADCDINDAHAWALGKLTLPDAGTRQHVPELLTLRVSDQVQDDIIHAAKVAACCAIASGQELNSSDAANLVADSNGSDSRLWNGLYCSNELLGATAASVALFRDTYDAEIALRSAKRNLSSLPR